MNHESYQDVPRTDFPVIIHAVAADLQQVQRVAAIPVLHRTTGSSTATDRHNQSGASIESIQVQAPRFCRRVAEANLNWPTSIAERPPRREPASQLAAR